MTRSPTSTKPRRGVLARATGAAAELAGRVLGVVGRGLPGVAGPILVSFGMWLAWPPLGFVAAGAFLLLLDRRVS